MSTFDGHHDPDRSTGSGHAGDGDAGFGAVLAVHACSRIGMQANPPRSGFGSWFRRR
ncbi:MAG: hypothetical protein U0Q20_03410 [Mycobacterium sp.]